VPWAPGGIWSARGLEQAAVELARRPLHADAMPTGQVRLRCAESG